MGWGGVWSQYTSFGVDFSLRHKVEFDVLVVAVVFIKPSPEGGFVTGDAHEGATTTRAECGHQVEIQTHLLARGLDVGRIGNVNLNGEGRGGVVHGPSIPCLGLTFHWFRIVGGRWFRGRKVYH